MSENTARNSVWYGRWMKMLEWLETDPPKEEILRKLDVELDKRHAYGSRKNAYVASNALERVIEDRRRLENIEGDRESALVGLASCCWNRGTVGKAVEHASQQGDFDEKVDEVFDSVYRSLSRKRDSVCAGGRASELFDRAVDCLRLLGEDEKVKKLERARTKWMARALSGR